MVTVVKEEVGLLTQAGHVVGEFEMETLLLLVSFLLLPAADDSRLHHVTAQQPADVVSVRAPLVTPQGWGSAAQSLVSTVWPTA
jgi:hypothetical protein